MGMGAMVELWGNQFDRSTLLGDLLAVLPASSMHAAECGRNSSANGSCNAENRCYQMGIPV